MDAAGNVWSCGRNYAGQCGLGHREDVFLPTLIPYFKENEIQIIKICAGANHNLALDAGGNVYSWGDGYDGKLGCNNIMVNGGDDEDDDDDDDDTPYIITPRRIDFGNKEIVIEEIQCGNGHSYCRSIDNRHYLFGENYDNECLVSINTEDDINQEVIHCVETPTCVNDIIGKVYADKTIKCIKLGYDTTLIELI